MKRIFGLLFSAILLIGCSGSKENWAISEMLVESHQFTDKKVKIAVLDSGIAKIDPLKKSIIYSYNTFNATEKTDDQYGHGTIVASLIAGKSDEYTYKDIGLNPNAEILDIQVLDEKGVGKVENVVNGINKAIEEKADIINFSSGFMKDYPELREVTQKATTQGIIVIASAGNMLGKQVDYPAQYDNVISVSAVDQELKKYVFANTGKVDFVAPGVEIPAINNKSELTFESGTSFSTAYISALVSLYLEKGETITLEFLKEKADKLGDFKEYGYGILKYE